MSKLMCPFCRSIEFILDNTNNDYYYYKCKKCHKIFRKKRYMKKCKFCKSSEIAIYDKLDKKIIKCFSCGKIIKKPL